MKRYLLSFLLIAVSFVIGVIALPYLPDQVAMHWNINGEADQFWNKSYAVFFGPLLMIVLFALLTLMPKIDPKKENYKKFSGTYNIFVNLFIVFFFVIHLVTIGYNLGLAIDISFAILIAIGFLYIILGNYMPRIKHNYFAGIRTPWTLANEKTWTKTHQLGGKVFVLGGICMIFISFLPGLYKFISLMVILVTSLLILTISSYIFYNRYK
ncbi:membrane protein [Bacillus sp. SA1-12]|uniref:SdpI family protein n=1 Tax=Bacillus sp. SA1-12 TaxID=1455638 RepID=UPI0006260875|nr:SdpI family protein [Bacillus sp. SA1-12]KKI93148.1 membrane protein [Bacillus sp. SA1-12]